MIKLMFDKIKKLFLRYNFMEKDCAACGARDSMFTVESKRRDGNDSSVAYTVGHLKCKVCGTSYAGKHEKLNEIHMTMAQGEALSRLYQRVREIEDKLSMNLELGD